MSMEYVTLAEIKQQGKVWKETLKTIENSKNNLEDFFNKIDLENRTVIFTGAGTSEFVGNTITPRLGTKFLSIATTDIVSNPENYFKKNEKILLVSCARSGNSPESVATVKLADQIVEDIAHVIITCNHQGALAKSKSTESNSFVLLMPPESNDKGFAMTSSFTSMSLAGLTIFKLDKLSCIKKNIDRLVKNIEAKEPQMIQMIGDLVKLETSRIVYLGSSCLKGLAEEASLKCLELTAGHMSLHYNSPLGFRHGPKSIVNDSTLIITMLSNNEYTRKYEIDLLKEMYNEKNGKKLLTIDMLNCETAKDNSHYYFSFNNGEEYMNEVFNMFPYVYFAQLFAFYKSLSYGINPDNPCPTGEVNRVVKGVYIYDYKGEN